MSWASATGGACRWQTVEMRLYLLGYGRRVKLRPSMSVPSW
jgi:hypothetical protein